MKPIIKTLTEKMWPVYLLAVALSLAGAWYMHSLGWFVFLGIISCACIWMIDRLGPVQQAPADAVKTQGSTRFYQPRYIRVMARIPRITVYWILAVLCFILFGLLYEFLSRNPF